MEDYEKLGVFYLGREYDLGVKKLQDNLLLYDSRDLVTHAVVVGMTGSCKTGLCIGLIEEAAIDGVPSILIDPKGDLTNLMLTFPQLRSEDFLPWVNPDDASRQGLTVPDYADQQANFWQKGLTDWGESGERIQRLRDAADFVIYTPGSSAGVPVSILKSFAAPPPEIIEDGELFQERINTNAWLEGVPLDIGQILYTPQSKPRVAIFSIAHLSDSERMFFVSLLLNQILGWMRTQPGTTSLRALVYMDEIFGYFPPVANPPSKQPLLTRVWKVQLPPQEAPLTAKRWNSSLLG